MQTLIMVVLSTTVLLGGCAVQSKHPADSHQPEPVVRNPYRYDDHRPHVRPRFDGAQEVEYRFVPARRYHGRGQFSHYNWVRQP